MMFGSARRKGIGALTAAAMLLSTAAPLAADTLAGALTAAYNHSGLIEKNRATLRAADEDVAAAMAQLRPVIGWASNVRRSFGTRRTLPTAAAVDFGTTEASISLSAELVLYAGGRNKLAIDAAKESVLATRASLVSVEQQVLFRAVSAFMEVRRAQETVALRKNNVRVIRQEVRAAKDRFEVGEITRTDVSFAEARLSAAHSQLAGAEGQLVSAFEEYRAAVGHKPKSLTQPRSLPRLPRSVEVAKKQAVREHPDMLRTQHAVTASEIGVMIAQAATKPTVSLRSSLTGTDTFGNNSFSRAGVIELGASGPIYNGGALASAVRKAKAQRDSSRSDLHIISHDLRKNVGDAYVRLEVARASRAAFESQVRAATVAFRGVREEAKLGARTTLDVLDAEQELLDARASLISAQVDESIAAYAVLVSVGKLTAKDLQLKVPHFDPASYYNLVRKAPAAKSKQGKELDRVLRALGKN
ncbi:MAG: TolC family outer membrane protein [Pelagimonas sp.]|jgi:outer membrane protein|nr:TolC family outer membrane protein [Pelagimonas sp.]